MTDGQVFMALIIMFTPIGCLISIGMAIVLYGWRQVCKQDRARQIIAPKPFRINQ